MGRLVSQAWVQPSEMLCAPEILSHAFHEGIPNQSIQGLADRPPHTDLGLPVLIAEHTRKESPFTSLTCLPVTGDRQSQQSAGSKCRMAGQLMREKVRE